MLVEDNGPFRHSSEVNFIEYFCQSCYMYLLTSRGFRNQVKHVESPHAQALLSVAILASTLLTLTRIEIPNGAPFSLGITPDSVPPAGMIPLSTSILLSSP